MKRKVCYINQNRNVKTEEKTKNNVFVYLVIVIGAFLLVQLLILSVVGTRGAELAMIQREQEEVEERIRLIKSEISESTSLDRIELIATEILEMKTTEDVKYINDGGYISIANLGE